MWHVFFLLPSAILWPAAGLAAQPPHLKEQSDAQMRLWRGVSTSWCNQLVDWEATPDLSRALRREKSKRWSFLRKCDRIGSIFGGIDSHAWRSRATHKHVSGFLPNFLSSREIYRFSQQQFSCAQRAQRKFRMESRRSVAKLALCKERFYYSR